MDVYVLAFAADPRVNDDVASRERRDPAGTPHASCPPSPLAFLNPCRGRRGGERMNDPRLADMRMEDDPVGVREDAQGALAFFDRDAEPLRDFTRTWNASRRQ